VRDRTFATLVLAFFATAGLTVSLTGIVGLVLFLVGRRTKEVAIRMALGATPAAVRWLIVRDTLLATASGTAAGLIASFWLSRVLATLLFQVPAGDPATLAAAAGLLALATVLAALFPARRASRLQPTEALRVS
jgi:ABC-type antimicrobial peptide transport system permease subunit